MSKTNKKTRYDIDEYDEFVEFNNEKLRHLKEKRIQRALKTRNIDELLDLDGDY